MVTKATNANKTNDPVAKWGNESVETIPGVDLVNKVELVDVPFLMTGFKFTHNETSNIGYVYVEYETDPGGQRKMFNDSSTGVRAQIEAICAAKGIKIELEKWEDVRLLAPRGLRVSEYSTKDERNRDTTGRTYYLTTSGGRA